MFLCNFIQNIESSIFSAEPNAVIFVRVQTFLNFSCKCKLYFILKNTLVLFLYLQFFTEQCSIIQYCSCKLYYIKFSYEPYHVYFVRILFCLFERCIMYETQCCDSPRPPPRQHSTPRAVYQSRVTTELLIITIQT